MANRFKRAGSHNWTDDTGWSTTSGGANDTIAPTASDDVFLDANSGDCTISATSVGKSLDCTGYTGTLTKSAGITISGSVTLVAGMTFTDTAGTLVLQGTGTLTTAGKLIRNISLGTSAVTTLGDDLNFADIKTASIQLFTITSFDLNGFTISGNSATNRVLLFSSTLGTPKTITNTTGTFANADFRDITLSTAADLSAITGLSGDCGGNTNITFTTAATQTYTGGTGSWSDVTKWTSRVPLPQDNVLMSGVTGGTITADMPRLGKSIDWTGASGSPVWSFSGGQTMYGSLDISDMASSTGGGNFTFEGRGTQTITSGGKTFTITSGTIIFALGTYSFQDAAIMNSGPTTGMRIESSATMTTNDFSLTTTQYGFSSATATTHNFGSSTITVTGTGNVLAIGSAATVNAGTSTILITDTGASTKTFIGGGQTYNNLSISGGGAGAVIITGANSFNQIRISGGTKSITLPGSTTTTINDGGSLGNETNVITFTSSAGNATVSKPTGVLTWDYVSLTNIPSTGGATFYAGANSTDGGGNTGWIFAQGPPPVASGGASSALMYTQGWT